MNLFVYGTLVSPAVQQKLLGRVLESEPARLENYCLIRTPASFGPYPIAITSKGAFVAGLLLHDLTQKDFTVLDEHEEVGSGPYNRFVVAVRLENGETTQACVYAKTRPPEPQG